MGFEAEVRRVNLRILAGDKIEDNFWISTVEVAVYDIYGNQVPSLPPPTISPQ